MKPYDLSIPPVPHGELPYTYHLGMAHSNKEWKGWGPRFRAECRKNQITLAIVAGRLDQAESTVRSWTNGNREINLSDFFRLCAAAEIEPRLVLFTPEIGEKVNDANEKTDILARAWQEASPVWREQLLGTAEAILKSRDQTTGGRVQRPAPQRR